MNSLSEPLRSALRTSKRPLGEGSLPPLGNRTNGAALAKTINVAMITASAMCERSVVSSGLSCAEGYVFRSDAVHSGITLVIVGVGVGVLGEGNEWNGDVSAPG